MHTLFIGYIHNTREINEHIHEELPVYSYNFRDKLGIDKDSLKVKKLNGTNIIINI